MSSSGNPCFDLLDRAVIHGRADELVLTDPDTTFAGLLEEVATVAGVLRAVEVAPGGAVRIDVWDDRKAVVATLAVLRLGAHVAADAPVSIEDRDGVHLVWGEGNVLDWDGVIRAGRTDPGPAHEGATGAPALPEIETPTTAADLRAILSALRADR